VYKKVDQNHFVRLSINTDAETDIGWFYTGNLQPNDEVVTRGAQLLLSEEFKYQITNENDD
jgi:membrane fusion protein, multidrug efflux system